MPGGSGIRALWILNNVDAVVSSRRRVVSFEGYQATFPGTVRFAPWLMQRSPFSKSSSGTMNDGDSDVESESTSNMVNGDEFCMEKMNKDLPP